MPLKTNFTANLRKRRQELGLTQLDVAERLGVSRPYVAQVEAGESSPGLDLVEKFAQALDCPALSLLVAPEDAEVAV